MTTDEAKVGLAEYRNELVSGSRQSKVRLLHKVAESLAAMIAEVERLREAE